MKRSDLSEKVVEYLLTLDISEYELLNVDSVARAFNVNRSYLSTRFKEDTHSSLKDYIFLVKILRATSLLESGGGVTINSIARMMGFSNPDYFIRIFKSKMGTTPGKYREYFRQVRSLNSLGRRIKTLGEHSKA